MNASKRRKPILKSKSIRRKSILRKSRVRKSIRRKSRVRKSRVRKSLARKSIRRKSKSIRRKSRVGKYYSPNKDKMYKDSMDVDKDLPLWAVKHGDGERNNKKYKVTTDDDPVQQPPVQQPLVQQSSSSSSNHKRKIDEDNEEDIIRDEIRNEIEKILIEYISCEIQPEDKETKIKELLKTYKAKIVNPEIKDKIEEIIRNEQNKLYVKYVDELKELKEGICNAKIAQHQALINAERARVNRARVNNTTNYNRNVRRINEVHNYGDPGIDFDRPRVYDEELTGRGRDNYHCSMMTDKVGTISVPHATFAKYDPTNYTRYKGIVDPNTRHQDMIHYHYGINPHKGDGRGNIIRGRSFWPRIRPDPKFAYENTDYPDPTVFTARRVGHFASDILQQKLRDKYASCRVSAGLRPDNNTEVHFGEPEIH